MIDSNTGRAQVEGQVHLPTSLGQPALFMLGNTVRGKCINI